MIIKIKKQAAVGLVLASIGSLCPLQAMENNQDQSSKWNFVNRIYSFLYKTSDTQQTMEYEQVDDLEFALTMSSLHNQSDEIIQIELSNQHKFSKEASLFNTTVPFTMLLDEIKYLILCNDFFEQSISNGNPMDLSSVCKDWYKTIQNNFKSIENAWKTHYDISESDYQLIKTMKVQYRPNPKSNLGMITLKIPTFSNPFRHTFNLSGCGDAGKNIRISMGYHTGTYLENKDKIAIFVAPRKLIEKDLTTSAAHYAVIMPYWNDTASVGIIFTDGGNFKPDIWFDYLILPSTSEISTKDCLKLLESSRSTLYQHPMYSESSSPIRTYFKHYENFRFCFEPK